MCYSGLGLQCVLAKNLVVRDECSVSHVRPLLNVTFICLEKGRGTSTDLVLDVKNFIADVSLTLWPEYFEVSCTVLYVLGDYSLKKLRALTVGSSSR